MSAADYVVVAVALFVLLASGFIAARRGTRNATDFILGGRKLPWWLAGSAMVAGSTSCDSPLHQSGKIRREGLGGAWFYGSQILAAIWHSLVFSRLWRRAGINTAVEFYDLRYGGKGGRCGRVWSMVFASLFGSIISLALGLLAMIKICQVLLDLHQPILLAGVAVPPEWVIVIAGLGLALGYSVAAGLRGVVAGDLIEFLLVLICSYVLAFFALQRTGHLSGLRAQLTALGTPRLLALTPSTGFSLFIFFFVQPLAGLAGDNGVNQRFLATQDERQAVFSGLARMINQYIIRTWPWYVCGLASLVLLPSAGLSSELAYPQLIKNYLPAGWRGLMFAGFLVAFMSCSSNALHNAGVVFMNDFYRPFLVRKASERHYVRVMRLAMFVTAIVASWIALTSDQILALLELSLIVVGASGLVMLLRWFWWRVNGWSDLAAQILALPLAIFFTAGPGMRWVRAVARTWDSRQADDLYGLSFFFTLVTTTVLWLAVMWLTPPEPPEVLLRFYQQVRPYGWWGPARRASPSTRVTDRLGRDLRRYALGLTLAMGLWFGFGLGLIGHWAWGGLAALTGSAAGYWIVRSVQREYGSSVSR